MPSTSPIAIGPQSRDNKGGRWNSLRFRSSTAPHLNVSSGNSCNSSTGAHTGGSVTPSHSAPIRSLKSTIVGFFSTPSKRGSLTGQANMQACTGPARAHSEDLTGQQSAPHVAGRVRRHMSFRSLPPVPSEDLLTQRQQLQDQCAKLHTRAHPMEPAAALPAQQAARRHRSSSGCGAAAAAQRFASATGEPAEWTRASSTLDDDSTVGSAARSPQWLRQSSLPEQLPEYADLPLAMTPGSAERFRRTASSSPPTIVEAPRTGDPYYYDISIPARVNEALRDRGSEKRRSRPGVVACGSRVSHDSGIHSQSPMLDERMSYTEP